MATTVTWTGATSSDWATASNWKTGKVPAAGNAVVIPTVATHAPILSGSSASIGALTLSGSTSLTIAAAGVLTLSSTLKIAAGGGLILQGGQVVDAASGGISLAASGGISGYGTIASKVAATSAASGTITATGGTLEIKSAVSNAGGLRLAIGSGATDTLMLDAASTAKSLGFAGTTGTLVIGSAAKLTLSTALAIGANTVTLQGKSTSLTDAAGISLGTGGQIGGLGTVSGALSGTGTLTASGGALVLANAIAASSGLAFAIADSAASILTVKGTVGAGNVFTFLGTHGALALADVTIAANGLHFAGRVDGLAVATSATPDLSTIDYINTNKTVTKVVVTDATHIALYNGTSNLGTITLGSAIGAGVHVDWHADSSLTNHIIGSGTDIFLSDVACYAAGTAILTPDGERAIETLHIGDPVLVRAGTAWQARPIRWIGHRRIDLAAHPQPQHAAPIRIRRGAFAQGMPHTDLLLSPDHAVFVDDALVCVRQLVNGATICREAGWREVTYFHLELDAHAILCAQGLPAESYLDTGQRGLFANAAGPAALHPDLAGWAACPARAAGSCARLLSEEATIRPIWQRLADRAVALGYAMPSGASTADPAMSVLVAGRHIRPVRQDGGMEVFVLPRGTREVHLRSRAGAPCEARPWLEDRRRLGVYVAQLRLRSASAVIDIPLDHPGLTQGWWAVERAGIALRRWTDGDARLCLPPLPEVALLEVRIGREMLYAQPAEPVFATHPAEPAVPPLPAPARIAA
ncbi:MAG: Hint domain-containing protein [Rhodospirillales bacterium]|nr:Hint domain-containing protein [Rhodospirillales bacterium]